jgi:hypothetical protein
MRRTVLAALALVAVQFLLAGLTLQTANADESKRLFEAVRANDIGTVRRLVGLGADPAVFNDAGLAPVDIAVDKGFFDIAHYLLAVQNQRRKGRLENNIAAQPQTPMPPLPVVTPAPALAVTVAEPVQTAIEPPSPTPVAEVAPEVVAPELVVAPQTVQMISDTEPEIAPATVSAPVSRAQLAPAPESDPPAVMEAPDLPTPIKAMDEPEEPEIVTETQPDAVQVAEQPTDPEPPLFQQLLNFLRPGSEPVSEVVSAEPVPSVVPVQPPVASTPPMVKSSNRRSQPQPLQNTLSQQVITEADAIDQTEPVAAVEPEPVTVLEPASVPVVKAAEIAVKPEPEKMVGSEPTANIQAAEPTESEPLFRKFLNIFQPSDSPAPVVKARDVTLADTPSISPEPAKVAAPIRLTSPEIAQVTASENIQPNVSDNTQSVAPANEEGFDLPLFRKLLDFINPDQTNPSGQVTPSQVSPGQISDKPEAPLQAPVIEEPVIRELTGEPEIANTEVAPVEPTVPRPQINRLPQAVVASNEPPPPAPTIEKTVEPEILNKPAQVLEVAEIEQAVSPVEQAAIEPAIEPAKVSAKESISPPVQTAPVSVPQVPQVDSPSLMDRLAGFFESGKKVAETNQEQAVPDTVATSRQPAPSPSVSALPTQPKTVSASLSPIPEPKPEAALPVIKAKAVTPVIVPSKVVLRADDMVFGDIGRLGKKLGEDRIGPRDCVNKPAWRSSFCIEKIDWPEEISGSFGNPSYYAGGGRAIVRYDGDRATQYHVLFPKEAFAKLAQYFKRKLGPPSESPEIWTAMLGEPRRFNKTFRWRAPTKSGNGYLMIEMREIDDLRWSAPPDVHHGVIRLHREGARPVFELLTTADLLLMQVRKGNYQQDIPPGERPKG